MSRKFGPPMKKPIMKPMPMPSRNQPAQVIPPKVNDSKSSWDKFKSWLKDNRVISGSLGALSRLEILNKYKDHLLTGSKMAEAVGYGKKRGMIKDHNKLCSCIHQRGGSWGDFVGWIKDRANDVGNAGKAIGKKIRDAGSTVYRRAIRPAYDYVKDHPVSTIGYLAKGLSYIPSPVSGVLSTAGTALGTAGTLTGKGQEGGSRKSHTGKVLMVF